ncbi:MAG: acetate/propionate family kinase [Chloroflexi bacterium]|nr:acetate/propionate family kinase [Chloroflexota bacterium]MCL5110283.1 acetate/propionate family kinase [Chloroflexota bacterium]
MRILLSNVGSTSLKYRLLEMDGEATLAQGRVERVGSQKGSLNHQAAGKPGVERELHVPDYAAAVKLAIDLLRDPEVGAVADLDDIAAVGFKVVHGGPVSGSALLDEKVLQALADFTPIAPAHNPPYIQAIRIFQRLLPGKPLVGVFETAFHRTLPEEAFLYSVPYEWYERYGVRRYGFHGASHRYVAERTAAILARPLEELKIVTCHLGGSSSLCAVKGGHSIDTSMGFSLQAGVPMTNRHGDIDAWIVPYMVEKAGLTLEEVKQALAKGSGLLGLSGLSGDVRDLEEAAAAGHKRAALALNVFAYQVKKYIGAYAAALGGLDAVAFAGGIGERGVAMRRRICQGLDFLGIALDPSRDEAQGQEAIVSPPGAWVAVLVVPTNEEIVVARETVKVIGGNA